VRAIAAGPAASNADAVDRDARFPSEAIDALRDARALSAHVPTELGGAGVTLGALAAACRELGRGCAATAMIFAMHQIQVACIVRHLGESTWFSDYLRRLDREQRLIASATSEVGTGGDMTRSIAGIEAVNETCRRFVKQATTVSYGLHADDLLTTIRRSSDAEPADQVLVLTTADQTQFEQTSTWDTLGMRGTCSPGFVVRAAFANEQVLSAPFSVIAAETMVPFSHLLWSELWLGIATNAFERARGFMRERARSSGGAPDGAERVSMLMTDLSLMRAEVESARAAFEQYDRAPGRPQLSTMAAVLRFNNLKIAASEKAAQITLAALSAIGILGYKNDTPFSVGRHVRDTLSAPLMVSNPRIHATNASLLLIAKEV
jgi:acyl-CoA dehydrogenase